jgi:hypothetical protein
MSRLKKKKIIIDYLIDYFNNFMPSTRFVIVQEMIATNWAEEQYDAMDLKQRDNIFLAIKRKEIKQKKIIIDYLIKSLSSSMLFSEFSEPIRSQRIAGLAKHKYKMMSKLDKMNIISEIDNP